MLERFPFDPHVFALCRRRYRRVGGIFLFWLGVSVPVPAFAVLPLPTYPECGAEPDAPENCPSDFGEPWQSISYIKDDYAANVRSPELEIGSGIHLDQAFALETGDFSITIASLDSGIEWDEGNTLRKWRLNTEELPMPQFADGTQAGSYDLNGDGLVNIEDYREDPRVSIEAGVDIADDILDPSDLIHTFSDGIDDDGNGYIDDICGWDFLWNDNDPFDETRNQGYSHGTIQIRRAAAEGGDGGSIGACPNCSTLMLRIGDSFISESTAFAQAIVYAVDMGAKVLMLEIGGLSTSSLARDAVEYAWENDVTIIASAADEASIHANQPSALHHTIVVHPVTYSGTSEEDSNSFLVFNNCSNFGGRPTLSIAYDGCSSEATAVGAGLAGLIQSASLHTGLNLSANEIHQLFTQTVDDIYVPEAYYGNQHQWYPSKPGFDRYFGYGRANIGRAIERIYEGKIPPEADLLVPDWFEVIDPERTPQMSIEGYVAANRSSAYTFEVQYGPGLDPEASDFVTIASGTGTSPFEGVLATWNVADVPTSVLDPASPIPPFMVSDDNVTRMDKINVHTLTLRVRVTDAEGLVGEMRKTVYLHSDPDVVEGFPITLEASLEASPKLADLDGDGRDEIIQPTSDGVVHVFRADGTELSGWPVYAGINRMLDPELPDTHVNAPAFASGALDPLRAQAVLGPAALGDLDGDGSLEVVVSTWDGEVFAWRKDGSLLDGFPVSLERDAAKALAGETEIIEDGFFAPPVLGDLDGDGTLEIVAGGMDQQVYAWDFTGESVPGWPVDVHYPFPTPIPTYGARIISALALGDVDNDGLMDVVVGTGEQVDLIYSPTYLIHGDGNLHRGGPFHRGWPILTISLFSNLLPDIGTGTTSSPVLADIDGDGQLEVAVHSVAGYSTPERYGTFFRADGSVFGSIQRRGEDFGYLSNSDEPTLFPLITSGAFGDMDRDGDLDYTLGMGGGRYLGVLTVNNVIVNGTFTTGAWDASTGEFLDGFPQVIADMQFFSHQSLADVDGDSYPESISTNGAFTIHGFNHRGEQPEGWPKFTGQWSMATPALGDIDGDGLLEMVLGTRSGRLFAWETSGQSEAAGGVVEWPSFHGDARNSGCYRCPSSVGRMGRR